jgi:hypothetical protein
VLYENKNTQNWKCFKLQKDEQLWAEVLDRCNRIIAMSEPPEKCGGNKWCSCREVEV